MIEEVGILTGRVERRGNQILTVKATIVLEEMKLGDSVAVNGPCLTVVEILRDSFRVEATEHTIRQCTICKWSVGRRVNLERALKVGDRIGGHIVQGHIDGTGKVARLSSGSGSTDIYLHRYSGKYQ